MSDFVRSRLNYYEVLGVSPTAGSDEISRAFAKEGSVFRPHAFGRLAEVCLAYETLRDPVRRRAYDRSLGLDSAPDRDKLPAGPQIGSPLRPVLTGPAKRPVIVSRPPPPPFVDPTPQAEPQFRSGPEVSPSVQPHIGGDWQRAVALDGHLGAGVSPAEWKRTGMAIGGLVAAAVLVGGLAGWWSGSDAAESQRPKHAASTSLPRASRPVASTETQSAPVVPAVEPRPDRSSSIAATARRTQRAPELPQLASADEQPQEVQPQQDQADSGGAEQLADEQVATEAAPAPTAAAGLPLPDRMVARTIERIGYSCGKVASTAPADGEAPGVYKVTCTSGQSYQAKPVKGRYHFRRWGRN